MVDSIRAVIVAGSPGAGKTTWIQQQLAQQDHAAIYWCPGAMAVDRVTLGAQFPEVKMLTDGEEARLLEPVVEETIAYIEVGFHLDLASVSNLLKLLPCQKIAVLPPSATHTEWHSWADQVIEGIESSIPQIGSQIWRAPLTGEVLDLSSLEMFWYELTAGAYGAVQRSKGVFDVADGRSLHFDFVARNSTYAELELPIWSKGRPTRFSGIEAIGEALDQEAIAQTLKECCLSDQVIEHYQQQIRESLESLEETLV